MADLSRGTEIGSVDHSGPNPAISRQKENMSLAAKFLVVILVAVANAKLAGIYFEMGSKETRCFLEEMPKDTMMTGKYHAKMVHVQAGIITTTASGLGMKVKVTDPEGKLIMDRMYGHKGTGFNKEVDRNSVHLIRQFTFTTHTPGNHKMCISSNETTWTMPGGQHGGQRLRVDLSLSIGENKDYYKRMVKEDKLSKLQLQVVQLSDQVSQIQKEQDFQRYREEGFRKISEILNSRVLWWAVVQVTLVIVVGLWQTTHMRSFFLKKKIV